MKHQTIKRDQAKTGCGCRATLRAPHSSSTLSNDQIKNPLHTIKHLLHIPIEIPASTNFISVQNTLHFEYICSPTSGQRLPREEDSESLSVNKSTKQNIRLTLTVNKEDMGGCG